MPDMTADEQTIALERAAANPYVAPPAWSTVLVDIDGTVAIKGDRDIYDASRAHLDTSNERVVELVEILADLSWAVVFLTGRCERDRTVTEAWLREHLPFTCEFTCEGGWALHMRADGDFRDDSLVKLELFDRHVRNHHDVRFVLDDRTSVVKMWRALGLTCLQVAEGDF